jgi:hypothetical protein
MSRQTKKHDSAPASLKNHLGTISPLKAGLRPPGRRGRPNRAEMAAMQKLLSKPKKEETAEQRLERISERFEIMYKLGIGAANGIVRALIVSGAPGIGKSYNLLRILEDFKNKNKIRYEQISGTMTAVNLYKQMYKYPNKGDILLLDDADSIYEDEDAMNLLKVGLDTTRNRKVSWLAESNALKGEGIDTQFIYEGTMIFVTNRDFQSEVDYGRSKMAKHFEAFIDRGTYLDLQIHDIDDVIVWVQHLVRKAKIMVGRGCSAAQQEQGLTWITKHYGQLRNLSIRTVLKLADYMVADPQEWERFARNTLLR